MRIVVSSTPSVFLPRGIRAWIYFGKDLRTAERLEKTFGIPPVDYSRKLYDVSSEKRAEFVRWMDTAATRNERRPEWFFSVPAVKNTHFSDLFLNLCYFLTAMDALKDKTIELVAVDSPALAAMLHRYVDNAEYPASNRIGEARRCIRIFIRAAGRFLKFAAVSLRAWISAKLVLGHRAAALLRDKKDIIAVRNYINGDFTDAQDDIFEKHYFPGLGGYLKEQGKTPVFLSIPIRVSSYRKLFKNASRSSRLIIFAEEFLRLKDYIHAWGAPFRASTYHFDVPAFRSFDIQGLLDEDYRDHLTENGFLQAVLLSRLGQRLKTAGVGLETLINWSEFQAFEKGLIFGLRKAYPQLRVIASQPFCAPPNHLSLFLSRQDKLLNMMPDKILVLGPFAKEHAAEFVGDVPVGFTPAFRYHHLFNSQIQVAGPRNLLVLFGYGLANSVRTLRLLLEIQEELSSFDRVLIKIHPSGYFGKKQLLAAIQRPLPEKFVFVEGGLQEHLPLVAVGLCGATGAAVELVSSGIPVVIAAEDTSLTMNYLVKDAHPDLWQLCFSARHVVEALQTFSRARLEKPQRIAQSAAEFRRSYFAEPSAQSWSNYLNLGVQEYHYAA